jgi:hypothetical protein
MRVAESVIAHLLLNGRAGDRLLGDTPIQPEVWRAFASARHDAVVDLIVTPMDTLPAAELSRDLLTDLLTIPEISKASGSYGIFPLEGFIAIRLGLDEFARVLLPAAGIDVRRLTDDLFDLARATDPEPERFYQPGMLTLRDVARLALEHIRKLSPLQRTMLLVLLLLAKDEDPDKVRAIGLRDLQQFRTGASPYAQAIVTDWVNYTSPTFVAAFGKSPATAKSLRSTCRSKRSRPMRPAGSSTCHVAM